MMTLNLLRAEWLKTRKRPINRGMLGIMILLLVVGFVIVTGLVLWDRDTYLSAATSLMPFPHSLSAGTDLLTNLGSLFIVVFVANSVGSEYGRDTWKVILPRHGSRCAFLVTKWIVGLAALLLLTVATLSAAMLLGWVGTLLLGISAEPSSASEMTMLLRGLGITMLEFVFLGTLTFFGAVITRSTIGAVIISLLVPVVLTVLQEVLPLLIAGSPIVLPTAHIQNLRAHWAFEDPQLLTGMTTTFNGAVSPSVSLLIVLGYIALLVGASLVIFQRRDLAGE